MSFKYDDIKCPDCDGDMISRTGKFGVFWGCKKFPECKGTRDSEGRSKADREKWKSEQLEDDSSDEMTSKERAKKRDWNVR